MQTTEVKTCDLEGAALDWAVAKAAGINLLREEKRDLRVGAGHGLASTWAPSTNWAQGGPLIERYHVELFIKATANGRFGAKIVRLTSGVRMAAETYLIAAMRAIVAAELGDTVDVPEGVVK